VRSASEHDRSDDPRVAVAPQGHGGARVVRVVPDVTAIDKAFDYLVPERFAPQVRVGAIVRINLHGRRVAGWVVEDPVASPASGPLKDIAKVTGWGPPADLVELSSWAAWRWAGRRRALLRAASPPGAVASLPAAPRPPAHRPAAIDAEAGQLAAGALADGGAQVLRLPPATDPYEVVLAAARLGPTLVVAASVAAAAELAARLRRTGLPATVVPRGWAAARRGGTNVLGARSAVWAPAPRAASIVVLDEHDETLQEERAPTWHARDVAVERARRAGVPVLLVSPCPTLEAQAIGPLRTLSRAAERTGWPIVDVIDRSDEDPLRSGLLSDRLTDLVRSDARVVCILNRTGRSRLSACVGCGALAVCERCAAAVAQDSAGALVCARCGTARPALCLSCGRTALKNLRQGVTRVREELEALARRPVVEITAASEAVVDAGLVVGTEAALHRTARVDAVVLLDLDQELLAPRARAAEQALSLVVRAARVVGGRSGGGRLLLQTRLVDHEVVQAALHADPTRVAVAEAARREVLRLPPTVALAEVSGEAAAEFVIGLDHLAGVEVRGPAEGRWQIRAVDHNVLCDALAAAPRPAGRLRISVDPART
jgi:primosomal protein N' (replication factor Y)